MSHKHPLNTLAKIILCLLIGGLVGYTIPSVQKGSSEISESIHQASGYTFISPLIECETKTLGNNQKYIPFEKDIIRKISDLQEKNKDIHISVYFRNLRNGPWFGINEDASYSPASLMKLTILFTYLKWQEIEPNILQKVVMPTANTSMSQLYQPSSGIDIGTGYTIADLLYHLIVYSDNTASNTLLSLIPRELQDTVYTDLGIPAPKTMDYTLSVKEYASFFRILYNASYLTRDSSESALRLLSLSTFTGGLTGKLPSDIVVAHKFGERELLENGEIVNQLHDCGIVYYEKYPYLICIMTRGKTDMNHLSSLIQDISKDIFDEIRSRYN